MEPIPTQTSAKNKLAVCGSRFLSGLGAAAAGMAVAAPFIVPPEIAKETASALLLAAATFSAAAQNTATGNKTEKLSRFQNKFTKLSLCGFAFLTGTSEITEDMQRIEDLNQVRPFAARIEKPVDDDELRQYWQSVIANKSISLEELANIAAKTSAKDLPPLQTDKEIALTTALTQKAQTRT